MKKLFSLILALSLVLALGTAALAGDTDFTRAADITYRGISIIVNGTKIVPQDANGNPVEPFIMDGTTYLPVRAVAGALGLLGLWAWRCCGNFTLLLCAAWLGLARGRGV